MHATNWKKWLTLAMLVLLSNFVSTRQLPKSASLRPSLSCVIFGDRGCNVKCNIVGYIYRCTSWNPYCDGVHCDCREQYDTEPHFPLDVLRDDMSFKELLAYRFLRTPVFRDLRKRLRQDPDLKNRLIHFLRTEEGYGPELKQKFKKAFPEIKPFLKRLKPRLKPKLEAEITTEELKKGVENEKPEKIWGTIRKWWEKPKKFDVNGDENQKRIIELIKGIKNKDDLLKTLQMLKDSGEKPLFNGVVKHFLLKGLTMPDGTEIVKADDNPKTLKKRMDDDELLKKVEQKIIEEKMENDKDKDDENDSYESVEESLPVKQPLKNKKLVQLASKNGSVTPTAPFQDKSKTPNATTPLTTEPSAGKKTLDQQLSTPDKSSLKLISPENTMPSESSTGSSWWNPFSKTPSSMKIENPSILDKLPKTETAPKPVGQLSSSVPLANKNDGKLPVIKSEPSANKKMPDEKSSPTKESKHKTDTESPEVGKQPSSGWQNVLNKIYNTPEVPLKLPSTLATTSKPTNAANTAQEPKEQPSAGSPWWNILKNVPTVKNDIPGVSKTPLSVPPTLTTKNNNSSKPVNKSAPAGTKTQPSTASPWWNVLNKITPSPKIKDSGTSNKQPSVPNSQPKFNVEANKSSPIISPPILDERPLDFDSFFSPEVNSEENQDNLVNAKPPPVSSGYNIPSPKIASSEFSNKQPPSETITVPAGQQNKEDSDESDYNPLFKNVYKPSPITGESTLAMVPVHEVPVMKEKLPDVMRVASPRIDDDSDENEFQVSQINNLLKNSPSIGVSPLTKTPEPVNTKQKMYESIESNEENPIEVDSTKSENDDLNFLPSNPSKTTFFNEIPSLAMVPQTEIPVINEKSRPDSNAFNENVLPNLMDLKNASYEPTSENLSNSVPDIKALPPGMVAQPVPLATSYNELESNEESHESAVIPKTKPTDLISKLQNRKIPLPIFEDSNESIEESKPTFPEPRDDYGTEPYENNHEPQPKVSLEPHIPVVKNTLENKKNRNFLSVPDVPNLKIQPTHDFTKQTNLQDTIPSSDIPRRVLKENINPNIDSQNKNADGLPRIMKNILDNSKKSEEKRTPISKLNPITKTSPGRDDPLKEIILKENDPLRPRKSVGKSGDDKNLESAKLPLQKKNRGITNLDGKKGTGEVLYPNNTIESDSTPTQNKVGDPFMNAAKPIKYLTDNYQQPVISFSPHTKRTEKILEPETGSAFSKSAANPKNRTQKSEPVGAASSISNIQIKNPLMENETEDTLPFMNPLDETNKMTQTVPEVERSLDNVKPQDLNHDSQNGVLNEIPLGISLQKKEKFFSPKSPEDETLVDKKEKIKRIPNSRRKNPAPSPAEWEEKENNAGTNSNQPVSVGTENLESFTKLSPEETDNNTKSNIPSSISSSFIPEKSIDKSDEFNKNIDDFESLEAERENVKSIPAVQNTLSNFESPTQNTQSANDRTEMPEKHDVNFSPLISLSEESKKNSGTKPSLISKLNPKANNAEKGNFDSKNSKIEPLGVRPKTDDSPSEPKAFIPKEQENLNVPYTLAELSSKPKIQRLKPTYEIKPENKVPKTDSFIINKQLEPSSTPIAPSESSNLETKENLSIPKPISVFSKNPEKRIRLQNEIDSENKNPNNAQLLPDQNVLTKSEVISPEKKVNLSDLPGLMPVLKTPERRTKNGKGINEINLDDKNPKINPFIEPKLQDPLLNPSVSLETGNLDIPAMILASVPSKSENQNFDLSNADIEDKLLPGAEDGREQSMSPSDVADPEMKGNLKTPQVKLTPPLPELQNENIRQPDKNTSNRRNSKNIYLEKKKGEKLPTNPEMKKHENIPTTVPIIEISKLQTENIEPKNEILGSENSDTRPSPADLNTENSSFIPVPETVNHGNLGVSNGIFTPSHSKARIPERSQIKIDSNDEHTKLTPAVQKTDTLPMAETVGSEMGSNLNAPEVVSTHLPSKPKRRPRIEINSADKNIMSIPVEQVAGTLSTTPASGPVKKGINDDVKDSTIKSDVSSFPPPKGRTKSAKLNNENSNILLPEEKEIEMSPASSIVSELKKPKTQENLNNPVIMTAPVLSGKVKTNQYKNKALPPNEDNMKKSNANQNLGNVPPLSKILLDENNKTKGKPVPSNTNQKNYSGQANLPDTPGPADGLDVLKIEIKPTIPETYPAFLSVDDKIPLDNKSSEDTFLPVDTEMDVAGVKNSPLLIKISRDGKLPLNNNKFGNLPLEKVDPESAASNPNSKSSKISPLQDLQLNEISEENLDPIFSTTGTDFDTTNIPVKMPRPSSLNSNYGKINDPVGVDHNKKPPFSQNTASIQNGDPEATSQYLYTENKLPHSEPKPTENLLDGEFLDLNDPTEKAGESVIAPEQKGAEDFMPSNMESVSNSKSPVLETGILNDLHLNEISEENLDPFSSTTGTDSDKRYNPVKMPRPSSPNSNYWKVNDPVGVDHNKKPPFSQNTPSIQNVNPKATSKYPYPENKLPYSKPKPTENLLDGEFVDLNDVYIEKDSESFMVPEAKKPGDFMRIQKQGNNDIPVSDIELMSEDQVIGNPLSPMGPRKKKRGNIFPNVNSFVASQNTEVPKTVPDSEPTKRQKYSPKSATPENDTSAGTFLEPTGKIIMEPQNISSSNVNSVSHEVIENNPSEAFLKNPDTSLNNPNNLPKTGVPISSENIPVTTPNQVNNDSADEDLFSMESIENLNDPRGSQDNFFNIPQQSTKSLVTVLPERPIESKRNRLPILPIPVEKANVQENEGANVGFSESLPENELQFNNSKPPNTWNDIENLNPKSFAQDTILNEDDAFFNEFVNSPEILENRIQKNPFVDFLPHSPPAVVSDAALQEDNFFAIPDDFKSENKADSSRRQPIVKRKLFQDLPKNRIFDSLLNTPPKTRTFKLLENSDPNTHLENENILPNVPVTNPQKFNFNRPEIDGKLLGENFDISADDFIGNKDLNKISDGPFAELDMSRGSNWRKPSSGDPPILYFGKKLNNVADEPSFSFFDLPDDNLNDNVEPKFVEPSIKEFPNEIDASLQDSLLGNLDPDVDALNSREITVHETENNKPPKKNDIPTWFFDKSARDRRPVNPGAENNFEQELINENLNPSAEKRKPSSNFPSAEGTLLSDMPEPYSNKGQRAGVENRQRNPRKRPNKSTKEPVKTKFDNGVKSKIETNLDPLDILSKVEEVPRDEPSTLDDKRVDKIPEWFAKRSGVKRGGVVAEDKNLELDATSDEKNLKLDGFNDGNADNFLGAFDNTPERKIPLGPSRQTNKPFNKQDLPFEYLENMSAEVLFDESRNQNSHDQEIPLSEPNHPSSDRIPEWFSKKSTVDVPTEMNIAKSANLQNPRYDGLNTTPVITDQNSNLDHANETGSFNNENDRALPLEEKTMQYDDKAAEIPDSIQKSIELLQDEPKFDDANPLNDFLGNMEEINSDLDVILNEKLDIPGESQVTPAIERVNDVPTGNNYSRPVPVQNNFSGLQSEAKKKSSPDTDMNEDFSFGSFLNSSENLESKKNNVLPQNNISLINESTTAFYVDKGVPLDAVFNSPANPTNLMAKNEVPSQNDFLNEPKEKPMDNRIYEDISSDYFFDSLENPEHLVDLKPNKNDIPLQNSASFPEELKKNSVIDLHKEEAFPADAVFNLSEKPTNSITGKNEVPPLNNSSPSYISNGFKKKPIQGAKVEEDLSADYFFNSSERTTNSIPNESDNPSKDSILFAVPTKSKKKSVPGAKIDEDISLDYFFNSSEKPVDSMPSKNYTPFQNNFSSPVLDKPKTKTTTGFYMEKDLPLDTFFNSLDTSTTSMPSKNEIPSQHTFSPPNNALSGPKKTSIPGALTDEDLSSNYFFDSLEKPTNPIPSENELSSQDGILPSDNNLNKSKKMPTLNAVPDEEKPIIKNEDSFKNSILSSNETANKPQKSTFDPNFEKIETVDNFFDSPENPVIERKYDQENGGLTRPSSKQSLPSNVDSFQKISADLDFTDDDWINDDFQGTDLKVNFNSLDTSTTSMPSKNKIPSQHTFSPPNNALSGPKKTSIPGALTDEDLSSNYFFDSLEKPTNPIPSENELSSQDGILPSDNNLNKSKKMPTLNAVPDEEKPIIKNEDSFKNSILSSNETANKPQKSTFDPNFEKIETVDNFFDSPENPVIERKYDQENGGLTRPSSKQSLPSNVDSFQKISADLDFTDDDWINDDFQGTDLKVNFNSLDTSTTSMPSKNKIPSQHTFSPPNNALSGPKKTSIPGALTDEDLSSNYFFDSLEKPTNPIPSENELSSQDGILPSDNNLNKSKKMPTLNAVPDEEKPIIKNEDSFKNSILSSNETANKPQKSTFDPNFEKIETVDNFFDSPENPVIERKYDQENGGLTRPSSKQSLPSNVDSFQKISADLDFTDDDWINDDFQGTDLKVNFNSLDTSTTSMPSKNKIPSQHTFSPPNNALSGPKKTSIPGALTDEDLSSNYFFDSLEKPTNPIPSENELSSQDGILPSDNNLNKSKKMPTLNAVPDEEKPIIKNEDSFKNSILSSNETANKPQKSTFDPNFEKIETVDNFFDSPENPVIERKYDQENGGLTRPSSKQSPPRNVDSFQKISADLDFTDDDWINDDFQGTDLNVNFNSLDTSTTSMPSKNKIPSQHTFSPPNNALSGPKKTSIPGALTDEDLSSNYFFDSLEKPTNPIPSENELSSQDGILPSDNNLNKSKKMPTLNAVPDEEKPIIKNEDSFKNSILSSNETANKPQKSTFDPNFEKIETVDNFFDSPENPVIERKYDQENGGLTRPSSKQSLPSNVDSFQKISADLDFTDDDWINDDFQGMELKVNSPNPVGIGEKYAEPVSNSEPVNSVMPNTPSTNLPLSSTLEALETADSWEDTSQPVPSSIPIKNKINKNYFDFDDKLNSLDNLDQNNSFDDLFHTNEKQIVNDIATTTSLNENPVPSTPTSVQHPLETKGSITSSDDKDISADLDRLFSQPYPSVQDSHFKLPSQDTDFSNFRSNTNPKKESAITSGELNDFFSWEDKSEPVFRSSKSKPKINTEDLSNINEALNKMKIDWGNDNPLPAIHDQEEFANDVSDFGRLGTPANNSGPSLSAFEPVDSTLPSEIPEKEYVKVGESTLAENEAPTSESVVINDDLSSSTPKKVKNSEIPFEYLINKNSTPNADSKFGSELEETNVGAETVATTVGTPVNQFGKPAARRRNLVELLRSKSKPSASNNNLT